MGFSPVEVDLMEPYQFAAAWTGWKAANTTPKLRHPTDDQFRAAVETTVH